MFPPFLVKTVLMKGAAPVDPECNEKQGSAHVYCEGKNIYDVMLNQVTLGCIISQLILAVYFLSNLYLWCVNITIWNEQLQKLYINCTCIYINISYHTTGFLEGKDVRW